MFNLWQWLLVQSGLQPQLFMWGRNTHKFVVGLFSEQSFDCFYLICLWNKAVKSLICCSWLSNSIRSGTIFEIFINSEKHGKTEPGHCDLNSLSCVVIVEMRMWFFWFSFIVMNINGTGWFEISTKILLIHFFFLEPLSWCKVAEALRWGHPLVPVFTPLVPHPRSFIMCA